jgi:hypothetical protein
LVGFSLPSRHSASVHPAVGFKIGGFEITVAAALSGAKLPPALVNPRQIRDCARAFGRLAKTHAPGRPGDRVVCRTRSAGAAAAQRLPSWSRAGARSLS